MNPKRHDNDIEHGGGQTGSGLGRDTEQRLNMPHAETLRPARQGQHQGPTPVQQGGEAEAARDPNSRSKRNERTEPEDPGKNHRRKQQNIPMGRQKADGSRERK